MVPLRGRLFLLLPITLLIAVMPVGCVGAQDDIGFRYGNAPSEPRMTLLQWSYGTSFSGGAPGMDEPLVGDRPDFTESSVTVGRGVAQLEFG